MLEGAPRDQSFLSLDSLKCDLLPGMHRPINSNPTHRCLWMQDPLPTVFRTGHHWLVPSWAHQPCLPPCSREAWPSHCWDSAGPRILWLADAAQGHSSNRGMPLPRFWMLFPASLLFLSKWIKTVVSTGAGEWEVKNRIKTVHYLVFPMGEACCQLLYLYFPVLSRLRHLQMGTTIY